MFVISFSLLRLLTRMPESLNKIKVMKKWLLKHRLQELSAKVSPGDTVAFLIRKSVFAKFQINLNDAHINIPVIDHQIDYDLKFDGNIIEMKLIFLTLRTEKKIRFMSKLARIRQNPFADDRVRPKKFKDHVDSILRQEGLMYDLDNDFYKGYDNASNLYILYAFTWLQPKTYFDIPIDTVRICATLPIILDYLANHFNLYDLIRIKLAFCNPLDPVATKNLQCEIDCLVHSKLTRTLQSETYTRNKQFDWPKYSFHNNIPVTAMDELLPLLYYDYHGNYFDTCETISNNKRSTEVLATIRLADAALSEADVLVTITDKSYVKFTIDGSGFDRMNFSLFSKLLRFKNVVKIILDTNYPLLETRLPEIHPIIGDISRVLEVHVVGNDKFNFLNEFVNFITSSHLPRDMNKYLEVIIKCVIKNYTIFDGLLAHWTTFSGIRITKSILRDLSNCSINRIRFDDCTFENEIENWRMLYNLATLREMIIHEDDDTWQCLFEFVVSELINFKRTHFRFNFFVTILTAGKPIHLNRINFTLDKFNSKLEITPRGLNSPVDLYELKNGVFCDNELSDYEFYE